MKDHAATQGACPFRGTRIGGALGSEPQLDHWWPNRLKVELLHQDPPQANPFGENFDYAEAFETLDLRGAQGRHRAFLHTFGRLVAVGLRQLRAADDPDGLALGRHLPHRRRSRRRGPRACSASPRSTRWWDNGNTDKSRRLLLPIKQKYGSRGQLGRPDDARRQLRARGHGPPDSRASPAAAWTPGRPTAATYWGPEGWNGKRAGEVAAGPTRRPSRPDGHPRRCAGRATSKDEHYDLENPLAASHQSLIYVDPEGPNGNGDPMDAARDIRETFARMAMNDEETVALIAGGHAFGKSHGMVPPDEIGPAPEGAPIKAMGLGWQNPERHGLRPVHDDQRHRGFLDARTRPGGTTPTSRTSSSSSGSRRRAPPARCSGQPTDPDAPKTPDAHVEGQMNALMMMTSDIALKVDPEYRKVCEKFLDGLRLLHRGVLEGLAQADPPRHGPEVPLHRPRSGRRLHLAGSDPGRGSPAGRRRRHRGAEGRGSCDTGLPVRDLVAAAWASASTYRDSDKRGGANGARVRLAPQKDWAVNNPEQLSRVLATLEGVKADFDGRRARQEDLHGRPDRAGRLRRRWRRRRGMAATM